MSAGLRRDVVILACAVSAGIHAAVAPSHFAESIGAGVGFVAAALMLAGAPVALALRPASRLVLAGAAATFAGLLVSYALATTTGVPVLHPHPEPPDALGLTTKAVELAGLVAALSLARRPSVVAAHPLPKGT